MATTKNANTNLFEFWSNAQNDLVNTWKDSAEKMKDTFVTNEAFENSGDYFQKWYNKQAELFNSAKSATNETNPVNWLNNWYKEQMDLTKEWTNQYNSLMNNNNFNWANPTETMTQAKDSMDKMKGFYDNWTKQATEMYNTWSTKLENPFQKDTFANMFNSTDVYMKSFEFWMPYFKNFQNNNFDMNMFKNNFSMDMFKDMMDKAFNFAPNGVKEMFDNMNKSTKDMFSQAQNNMWNMGQQFNNPFNNMMPQGSEFFNTALNNYHNFVNQFNQMNSPFMKMMTPGADKNNIEGFQNLNNEMVNFNTKSSQMQYLVYMNGLKAVQAFAENLKAKADKNETYENFTSFYQDWLNTMDASFVELFRSKEYSKVQAEFSSASHKIKKMTEEMSEKALAYIPVATRTEMSDLYKTVHEMNKRIKTLEAELATAKKANTTAKTAPKTTATKSAPKATTATKSAPKATTTKTATAKK